jgi:hypothetical protein
MDEKEFIDLIHREVDRLNTPEESHRLKECLKTDAEAQKCYDQFIAMSNMLGEVEEVTPPPDMKRNIMCAVSASVHRPTKRSHSLKIFLNSLRARFNYRYVYAFSFGLIAGFVLFSLYVNTLNTGGSFDLSDLYGTLIFNSQSELLYESGHIHIDVDDVQGTIGVKYYESIVIAELILESREPIEVILECNEDDMHMNGFFQSTHASSNVVMNDTHLRMTHLGENTYVVTFRDMTRMITSLDVRIVSSGTVIFSKAILPEKSDN